MVLNKFMSANQLDSYFTIASGLNIHCEIHNLAHFYIPHLPNSQNQHTQNRQNVFFQTFF